MKKIAISIITVMVTLISLSGVYASSNIGVLDIAYTDNVYKFSENGDINLPFIRMTDARMIMDKDTSKSGMCYANESISVLNNLKGIQALVSSDTVRITGNIEYGIVIAPTVIIEGTIEKSIIIVAQNITISKNAVIKEDLLCSATKLELLGNIDGSLLGTIGIVDIYGNILQDFRVNTEAVTLANDSKIQGNIYISSSNKINIGDKYPNATIKLEEKANDVYKIDVWKILRISTLFTLIFLLISNKTKIIKNTLNKIKTYKMSTIMFGLASIILIPLIFILIFILTLIGLGIIAIPIAVLYGSFTFITFMLSTLVVGSVMSEYVLSKYNDKVNGKLFQLILVLIVFSVLNIISDLPTIGSTISIMLCILSTGIVFTSIFRKIKE